ncbi:hypothetical protein ACE6H2_013331 [Prunus campanulata]
MGRGKFKSKPTGHRQFSTPEDLLAGTSTRPRTFSKKEAEYDEVEEEIVESSEEESGDESEGQDEIGKTTELSRRERAFSPYKRTKGRSC